MSTELIQVIDNSSLIWFFRFKWTKLRYHFRWYHTCGSCGKKVYEIDQGFECLSYFHLKCTEHDVYPGLEGNLPENTKGDEFEL